MHVRIIRDLRADRSKTRAEHSRVRVCTVYKEQKLPVGHIFDTDNSSCKAKTPDQDSQCFQAPPVPVSKLHCVTMTVALMNCTGCRMRSGHASWKSRMIEISWRLSFCRSITCKGSVYCLHLLQIHTFCSYTAELVRTSHPHAVFIAFIFCKFISS